MERGKTPDWIKEHLSSEEKVIASLPRAAVHYYATDNRLLKCKRKSGCESLEYNELSIAFKRYLRWPILSVILALLGLLVLTLAIVSFVGPEITTADRITSTKAPLCCSCGLSLLGLGCFGVPFLAPYGHYQIKGPGFDNEKLKDWRIVPSFYESRKAARFAEVIKQRVRETVGQADATIDQG